MKSRLRIVSGLAALAALFLAPLADASLTRVSTAERAIEAPALTLASPAAAPEPTEFSLFEGHELAPAATESESAPSFHPLAAVSLLSKNEADPPLVSVDELIYSKTRYRVFEFLGRPLIGVERGVSLELRWGCASFSCGLASGTVGWLSQDPLEDRDSPNLYGFVGARPHEKTDPLGLQEMPQPGTDEYEAYRMWDDTRAREERGVNAGKQAAGAIGQGLGLLTDFAPGIGAAKIPLFFIEAYRQGGRSELRRLGLSVATVAIVAAVITHGARLPGVKATEEELALEAKAEAALGLEQRQLAQQAAAAEAKASAPLRRTLVIPREKAANLAEYEKAAESGTLRRVDPKAVRGSGFRKRLESEIGPPPGPGYHADHTKELCVGGPDCAATNGQWLQGGSNAAAGGKIGNQVKNDPVGTIYDKVKLEPE